MIKNNNVNAYDHFLNHILASALKISFKISEKWFRFVVLNQIKSQMKKQDFQ